MREIDSSQITKIVKEMCIQANCVLNEDIKNAISGSIKTEDNETAKETLKNLVKNYEIAESEMIPVCQDTGMAVFFIDVGQDVHIAGNLTDAVNEGVRQGYCDGYLRKSVVRDPLDRVNTQDNTPAVIHYNIVEGDQIKITFAPKGFGSENMSRLKMLKPSDGVDGVIDFVVETVKLAGPNPCPPIVVGVGIGGTFEKAAQMAKFALTRPIDQKNSEKFYAELEGKILSVLNTLNIGPQGFGGKTTAFKVNIEHYPTHIAGLPVAVNINCHVTRHAERII